MIQAFFAEDRLVSVQGHCRTSRCAPGHRAVLEGGYFDALDFFSAAHQVQKWQLLWRLSTSDFHKQSQDV